MKDNQVNKVQIENHVRFIVNNIFESVDVERAKKLALYNKDLQLTQHINEILDELAELTRTSGVNKIPVWHALEQIDMIFGNYQSSIEQNHPSQYVDFFKNQFQELTQTKITTQIDQTTPTNNDLNNKQYVYLLENKYSPFVYKIGWTSRHPNTRALEISQGTGVVGTWQVSYFWQVDDGYWLEQRIFRELAKFRLERSEMFHMPNTPSKDVYHQICQFIDRTGESPKIAREKEEKQRAHQRECDRLKQQIKDRIQQLIDIESKPYKESAKLRRYVYWGGCILIATYWNYDDHNVFGSWVMGAIFGLILGAILIIPAMKLWDKIGDNNHLEAIERKYNKYQNPPDNIDTLRCYINELNQLKGM